MSTRRPARLWLGLLVSVVCFGIVVATPSAASALVGQLSIKNVPYIQTAGTGDSYARASTQIGTTVYVGGTFSQVFEPLSGTNYARPDLFAYNETSKLVSPFAPSVNGQVWGLAHSPDGQYLYAAGNFSTVNGLARKGLVQFDLSTGTVTAFNAHLDGQARTVDYVGTHLIVGGAFAHVNGVSGRNAAVARQRKIAVARDTSGPARLLHESGRQRERHPVRPRRALAAGVDDANADKC